MMLRAATAASGGTGAPFATYCSICAWTLRISAWISTPLGRLVGQLLDRARARYGAGLGEAVDADAGSGPGRSPGRCRPGAARPGRSWRACRPRTARTGRRCPPARPGAGSRGRSGRRLDGGVERGDALLAADLERDDHLREDDGLPERDERQLAHSAVGSGSARATGSLVAWPSVVSLGAGVGSAMRLRDCGCRVDGVRDHVAPRRSGRSRGRGGVGCGLGRPLGGPLTGSFVVQGFEDPRPEALLELEQGPDAGEVDAAVSGQVPDPEDPPDVLLASRGGCWSACAPGRPDPRPRRCAASADARTRASPPR